MGGSTSGDENESAHWGKLSQENTVYAGPSFMNRTKVAIVVLVLVAIVFVSTLGVGFSTASDGAAPNPDVETVEQPPDWTKSMGAILSPFAPKIELSTNVFEIPANRAFVDPQTGREEIIIPRSRQRLRTGAFRLAAGEAVELVYTDKTKDAPDKFRQQEFTLTPAADSNKQNIIAMESGGRLTMECFSTVNCQVVLGDQD